MPGGSSNAREIQRLYRALLKQTRRIPKRGPRETCQGQIRDCFIAGRQEGWLGQRLALHMGREYLQAMREADNPQVVLNGVILNYPNY